MSLAKAGGFGLFVALSGAFVAQSGVHAQNAVQRDLEYRALMMPVQRVVQGAYYANLCQLRSQAYFQTFLSAMIEISRIEATKRDLSNDQIIAADHDANAIMAREDTAAGLDNFEARCRSISDRLGKLDAAEIALTNNYH